jgi:hypothetical protein
MVDLPQRPELRAWLLERLPDFLTRPEDKKLFADLLTPAEDVSHDSPETGDAT